MALVITEKPGFHLLLMHFRCNSKVCFGCIDDVAILYEINSFTETIIIENTGCFLSLVYR